MKNFLIFFIFSLFTTSSYGGVHVTEIPSKPEAAVLAMKAKALSVFYSTVSKIVKNPAMVAIAKESIKDPTFEMIWIPSTKSMTVHAGIVPEKYDPALIMSVLDKKFVIGTWDVENEVSIDAYLREFSSGSMKNVVRFAKPVK
jgi:hypothetical protein